MLKCELVLENLEVSKLCESQSKSLYYKNIKNFDKISMDLISLPPCKHSRRSDMEIDLQTTSPALQFSKTFLTVSPALKLPNGL